MQYMEIIGICSASGTERINTLYGRNAELFNVKPGGTYSNHYAFKGKIIDTPNWKYGFFARNMNVGLSLSQNIVVQILRKGKHSNI